jgi:hypothetical protein
VKPKHPPRPADDAGTIRQTGCQAADRVMMLRDAHERAPSDLGGAIAAQRAECTPIASSRPSTRTTQRVPIQPAVNRRRWTVTEPGFGCLFSSG